MIICVVECVHHGVKPSSGHSFERVGKVVVGNCVSPAVSFSEVINVPDKVKCPYCVNCLLSKKLCNLTLLLFEGYSGVCTGLDLLILNFVLNVDVNFIIKSVCHFSLKWMCTCISLSNFHCVDLDEVAFFG